MANFVLVVEFDIRAGDEEKFAALIAENARASVANEEGCLQFDVVRAQDNKSHFVLYEVYADKTALDVHMKMPHVAAFFGQAKPMIAEQKVARLDRVSANAKRG